MKELKESINTYIEEEKPNYEKIPPGMLSSPHIKYCIEKYSIITCKGVDPKDLFPQVNSAVYEMRLGNESWGFDEAGKEFDTTSTKNDEIKLYPNSLTFLTTKEEFNLTKDIIARFNLKSKWVHKGLLLGTGPIVDPDFTGRLFIPVHNFSNKEITLKVGENLINVEFTKTLNPNTIFNSISDSKYVDNKKWDFKLLEYRKELPYLPSSSILLQESRFNRELEKQKNIISKFEKNYKIAGLIGFLTLIVTCVGIFFTIYSLHASFSDIVTQYNKSISEYNGMIRVEEKSHKVINTNQFVLRHEYDELNEKYNRLINELEFLKHTHKKNAPEAQKSH